MPIEAATIILNKYRILRLIGEGGMGRVWLAEEIAFDNRRVAIKEVRRDGIEPSDFAEQDRRFRQEVEISARLVKARAPYVVTALTAERGDDGSLLLVMEYAGGGSLADLITKHPQGMPVEQALTLVQQVCQALDAFHLLPGEPVHRDLKPSNILLTEDGEARLSDFGLAQLAGASSGRTQMTASQHPGTPRYMAPEQTSNSAYLSPAADIYALGCVLFEMLTGKRYKNCAPGSKPSQFNRAVPAAVDAAVIKALAEEPWGRYMAAVDFAAALGGNLSAAPPRRRKWAGAVLAIVAFLLASGAWLLLGRIGPGQDGAETVTATAAFSNALLAAGDGKGQQPPLDATVGPMLAATAATDPAAGMATSVATTLTAVAAAVPTDPNTSTAAPMETATPTDTATPTPLATATTTATATPTFAPTATGTPTPDLPATATAAAIQMATSVAATLTAMPTPTPIPTATPAPTASATATATPDWTATANAQATQMAEAIAATLTASAPTATLTPSRTPTPTKTATPSRTPTPTNTPTPSTTRTPTPTKTPTRTPEVARCNVLVDALNLRRGPGPIYGEPLEGLPLGTYLLPSARSADGGWLQVEVEGGGPAGWVSASDQYVSCNVAVGALPVGLPPPAPEPPTSTPTPPAMELSAPVDREMEISQLLTLQAQLFATQTAQAIPAAGPLQLSIATNSGRPYNVSRISDGGQPGYGQGVYTDRDYTYVNVPAFLSGAAYVLTANNDKELLEDQLSVTLTFDRGATVYVAHSDGHASKPAWLAVYGDTGQDLTFVDSLGRMVTLSVYARSVPGGSVTLGGNAPPSGGNHSMYTVFVKE